MSESHHIRVVEHDRYAEGTSKVRGDRYWTVSCTCGNMTDCENHQHAALADNSARQHAAWAAFSIEVPGTITIVRGVHLPQGVIPITPDL